MQNLLGDQAVSQFSVLTDAGVRLAQILATDASFDEQLQDEGMARLTEIGDALCALPAASVYQLAQKVRIWRVLAPEDISSSSAQADERLLASMINDIESLAAEDIGHAQAQAASS